MMRVVNWSNNPRDASKTALDYNLVIKLVPAATIESTTLMTIDISIFTCHVLMLLVY